MTSPAVNLTVLQNGLGIVQAASTTPLLMGCSSAGTVNTVYDINSLSSVVSTLGQGPLAEVAALVLGLVGGPVKCMRLTGTTAGAAGSVTATLVGTATGTITVANAPNDAYEVTIEIITTGTLGTGEFRYRLDRASTDLTIGTWSEVLTIPSGGTFVIPNTGLTLTFVPGAGAVFFEDGDVHTFTCTAPLFTTTDLASGFAALGSEQFAFIGLVGTHASASDGATMFAALDTHMTALTTTYQYAGAIMESGNDTAANAKTAFLSSASAEGRISVGVQFGYRSSLKPFAGWGFPKRSSAYDMIYKAAQYTVSDDLARFPGGALTGQLPNELPYDEAASGTLANTKLSSLRKFVGQPGVYINNAFIKSATGSDFYLWQHRRVMDLACYTAYLALLNFLSTSFRTLTDGTGRIDPRDAARVNARVNDALDAALKDPHNLDGIPHVSDVLYTTDETTDVANTDTITGTVAIARLGYSKTINVTLGYAKSVGS
ncbi:MAG: DUF2586 family protein [Candidatus Deferrimicrobiaceae bacterium]